MGRDRSGGVVEGVGKGRSREACGPPRAGPRLGVGAHPGPMVSRTKTTTTTTMMMMMITTTTTTTTTTTMMTMMMMTMMMMMAMMMMSPEASPRRP